MIIHQRKKTLERDAIVQIFAGMNFKTDINPLLIKTVENRPPTVSQFLKCLGKTLRIMRRPGVKIGPRQRSGKRGVRRQPQFLRGCRGLV
ncbi:hypothetical protein D3C73_1354720 [compost metagenome]